jgi:hypothetical protein
MGDTLYVTPAQVLAAKLELELSEEDGETPDEALKAIANADKSAPQQPTDNQVIQDPTPKTVNVPNWAAQNPGGGRDTGGSPERDEGTAGPVGFSAQQAAVEQRGGTDEQQKKADIAIGEYNRKQRERQEQRLGRDIEEPNRDPDEPRSGGVDR